MKKLKSGKKSSRPSLAETSLGTEILESLNEFTEALETGEVSKRLTCRRFKLPLAPTAYDGGQVKKTRGILGLSQPLFAQFLGVSPNTIRAWEQGVNTPPPIACRFMDEIRSHPEYWKKRLEEELDSDPTQSSR